MRKWRQHVAGCTAWHPARLFDIPLRPCRALPYRLQRSPPTFRAMSAFKSSRPAPRSPDGDDWLHEIKHDGHRLVAIITPDRLTLLSRNGYDRTALFQEPFRTITGLPPMALDGEIAVPDDRGVTHIDGLSEAISERRYDRLAYFAFDLLHFD